MKLRRALIVAAAAALTAGCHLLRPSCGGGVEDYQVAQQAPRLQVPQGMSAPDAKDALRIPPVAPGVVAPLGKNACLEKPPRYRENPRGVAAGSG
ncbi:MAG TPA: hypothetical protein VMU86_02765 [Steroidobacteraceae bacterium]|nr:hypothetical protein [Steroidobacteraceae bacterium]